ncbi:hypothetical protein OCU04_004259 [Sclerotinia nivalis]|uniref:Uncharacterized protein n=1 Tax=Sclerotinia nivalis TaxID=352851 RepID=A0A9X0AQ34_9HELO|nr:hypothetical protein OCU04_004259 [Sclerotinia nivalis]
MGGPLTLRIHHEMSKGQYQMFADFDFGFLHHIGATPGASGVFLFEQQVLSQKRKASRSSTPNAKRQRHDGIKVGLDKKNNQEDDDSNRDGEKIERPRGKSTTDMVSFWDNLGQNFTFPAQQSHQSSSRPVIINSVVQQQQWVFSSPVNIPIRLHLAIPRERN